jgi:hypothetical protein
VLELRSGASLAQELFSFRRVELALARDLDRDGTVQFGVTGFPYGTERTDADAFQQLEVANRIVCALRVTDRFVAN